MEAPAGPFRLRPPFCYRAAASGRASHEGPPTVQSEPPARSLAPPNPSVRGSGLDLSNVGAPASVTSATRLRTLCPHPRLGHHVLVRIARILSTTRTEREPVRQIAPRQGVEPCRREPGWMRTKCEGAKRKARPHRSGSAGFEDTKFALVGETRRLAARERGRDQ